MSPRKVIFGPVSTGKVGVMVRLRVGVRDGVGRGVGQRLGVADGGLGSVIVVEGLAVAGGGVSGVVRDDGADAVGEGETEVRVDVGEHVGDGSGVRVLVGGTEPPGTRTISAALGPTLPMRSRARAIRMVSPAGKAIEADIGKQNWAVVSVAANRTMSNSSRVHAEARVVAATKRQPKSFKAAATANVLSNCRDGTAGIPPPGSQTSGLPSPSARLLRTCRSGTPVGSPGRRSIRFRPTSAPVGPGAASTTTWNPKPAVRA